MPRIKINRVTSISGKIKLYLLCCYRRLSKFSIFYFLMIKNDLIFHQGKFSFKYIPNGEYSLYIKSFVNENLIDIEPKFIKVLVNN